MVYAYSSSPSHISQEKGQSDVSSATGGLVDVRVARIFDTYGPRMPLLPLPPPTTSITPTSSSLFSSSSVLLMMGMFITQALLGSDIIVPATSSTTSSLSSSAAADTKPLPPTLSSSSSSAIRQRGSNKQADTGHDHGPLGYRSQPLHSLLVVGDIPPVNSLTILTHRPCCFVRLHSGTSRCAPCCMWTTSWRDWCAS